MKSLSRQPQSPRQLPDSSSSLKVKVNLKVIALENLSAEKRDNHVNSNDRSTQNDHQPVFAILSLSSDQNNNNNNNMIRIPSLPIDPSLYSTFHFTGQKRGFDIQWPSDRGLASAETYRYLSPSFAQQSSTASSTSSYYETEYETEYLCMKLNLVRGNEMLDLGHAYFGIAGKEEHEDIFLTLPIKDEEQLHNDTTSRNERTLHAVPPNMVPTTSYDENDMNNKLSYTSPPVMSAVKEYPGQNYFPKDPSVGIHTSDDVTTLRIQISITKDLTQQQQQQQQQQVPLQLQVQPPEEEQLSPSAPSTRRKFSPKNLMSKSILKRKKRQHENTRSETVLVSSKTESKESEVPLKEEKKVIFADFTSLEEEKEEERDDSCIALSSSVEYPLEDFKKRTSDEKFESCEDTSLSLLSSDEERDDSEVEERRVIYVNEPEPPVNCVSISSVSSDQDRTPALVVDEEEKEKKVTFVDVRYFTSSGSSRNISSEEHKYESEDDDCNCIPLTGSVEYSLEEFKRITDELKKSSKSSDGRFRFRRAKSFSSKMSLLKKSTGQKFQNFFTKEYEKETYVPCASIEDCEDGTIATSSGIYIIDSYGHQMVMLTC